MSNTALVLVDPGDGNIEGQPAADFGVQVLTKAAVPTPQNATPRTLGEHLDGKANIGHTSAPDADYQALVSDVQIGFAVLTAPRTVILPDVDDYPLGQALVIADESGQCSPDRPILIVVGAGSDDTIAGQGGIRIEGPWKGVALRRGQTNLWVIEGRTINGVFDVPGLPDALTDARSKAIVAGLSDNGRSLSRGVVGDDFAWATFRSAVAKLLLSNGPYNADAVFPGGADPDFFGSSAIINGIMTIPAAADQNWDGVNPRLIINAGVSGSVHNKSVRGNGVALFGLAVAGTHQAGIWGVNTVCKNFETVLGPKLGWNAQINGYEIDIGIVEPVGGFAGTNVLGTWTPAESYGAQIDGEFTAHCVGIYGDNPWKVGVDFMHGSCTYSLRTGRAAKTGPSASMPMFWVVVDNANNALFMTQFVDKRNRFVVKPLNYSPGVRGGIVVQDNGGNDRVSLIDDGSISINAVSGGSRFEMKSSDGGQNVEIFSFKTSFGGTSGNKVLAELISSPDGAGGKIVTRFLNGDGSNNLCQLYDSGGRVTFGYNSINGGERLNLDGNIAPVTAGAGSVGISGKPFSGAYFQTQPSIGSDIRFKRLRGAGDLDEWNEDAAKHGGFTDAELDAWGEVSWRVYQMRDAIAEKGEDKARLHYGLIAQEVETACRRHGVDPARLALWLVTPVYGVRNRTEKQTRPTGKTITRKVLNEDGLPQKRMVPTGESANDEKLAVKNRERHLYSVAASDVGAGEAPSDEEKAAIAQAYSDLLRSDQEYAQLSDALKARLASMVTEIEIEVEASEDEMEEFDAEVPETYLTGETRLALRYDSAFAIEAAWSRRQMSRLLDRLTTLEAKVA